VPDGWQQGRGAWGGLVVGALSRAIETTEPDAARILRSVNLQMAAPAVVGEHCIEVTPVRVGTAMTTWSAVVRDARGVVIATMVAITGSPRGRDIDGPADWGALAPPPSPAAQETPRTATDPPFPVFTQHIDFRMVHGMPLGGGPAECLGWVDYHDDTPKTAVSLLALVDAWWPASLPVFTAMPRVATVNFTASLLTEPGTVSGPLLSHAVVSATWDGYTCEQRRLWSADGRLVVDNMQTIVVGA
jgi:hypothetical protein